MTAWDSAKTIGNSSSVSTIASLGKEMRYLVMLRWCPQTRRSATPIALRISEQGSRNVWPGRPADEPRVAHPPRGDAPPHPETTKALARDSLYQSLFVGLTGFEPATPHSRPPTSSRARAC